MVFKINGVDIANISKINGVAKAGIAKINGITIPSTLWTPMNLTNLKAWFDASDNSTITLNGSNVSQWNDKSGNGRHASQGTASAQPLFDDANNKISFDGGDSLNMTTTSANICRNIGELNCLALVKYNSTNGRCVFGASRNASTASRFNLHQGITATGLGVGGRRQDSNSFVNITDGNTSTSLLMQHGQLIYSSSDAYLFVNGAQVASNTSFQTDGNTDDTNSQGVAIGSQPGSSPLEGDIYQIVIAGAMTSTERQKLEGWCAHYTGNTALLASEHPYKSTPPYV